MRINLRGLCVYLMPGYRLESPLVILDQYWGVVMNLSIPRHAIYARSETVGGSTFTRLYIGASLVKAMSEQCSYVWSGGIDKMAKLSGTGVSLSDYTATPTEAQLLMGARPLAESLDMMTAGRWIGRAAKGASQQ